ncbi:peptidylprolyl isomerase [Paenibacillus sp. CAA11]|uniref:peptidylprolyl isomerase n=1 Tax=Paenibacillus sp. CAA11 TaxID=1532905 RepID=UPI000D3D4239|nr:peptidylprolyl isomerase [Paenibacillus sp. CAA11]AWB43591.1 peptidylprolyl isomerase [Paenibacillus sp. CAA11]
MKQLKAYGAGILSLLLVLVLVSGCGNNNTSSKNAQNNKSASEGSNQAKNNSAVSDPSKASDNTSDAEPVRSEKDPIVTIEMENGKTIKVELYPDVAPNTVNNFISLVKKGFYDGLTFHRVVPGFMIQGGDPDGNGGGGPGYSIPGEFTTNGFKNDLSHTRGVISMARAQDPNSAGSQFFIMVADADSLNGQYAAFGKVVEGMKTVDEIVSVPTNGELAKNPPVMKKVTVDTKGTEYKEPTKTESK